jgi:hypothetical protein
MAMLRSVRAAGACGSPSGSHPTFYTSLRLALDGLELLAQSALGIGRGPGVPGLDADQARCPRELLGLAPTTEAGVPTVPGANAGDP